MLLNEEQKLIQAALRDFARRELAPHAARWDREHTFPRQALQALGGRGVPPVARMGFGASWHR